VFACLESGWLAQMMEADRFSVQREKAAGERLIVGVNAFREEGEEGPVNRAIRDVAYQPPTEAMRRAKVAEVTQFKAARDMRRLEPLLEELYRATREGRNVQRAVIDAAKAGMTVGECVGVIRTGYGLAYDPLSEIDAPDFVRRIAGSAGC